MLLRIDAHVGSRLRFKRRILDFSQKVLAEKIGISHQQLHKYERGLNRITAGRLFQLSQVLEVPVSYFFDEMPEALVGSRSLVVSDIALMPYRSDESMQEETMKLIIAYYSISSDRTRKRIVELIRALGERK